MSYLLSFNLYFRWVEDQLLVNIDNGETFGDVDGIDFKGNHKLYYPKRSQHLGRSQSEQVRPFDL